MKKVLTLILFLTTHLCSQIKVQNFVDKKEVYLGDVVNYHIIIEHPKNIELSKFEIYNVIKDTTGAENFVLYSTKINKTKKLFSNKIIQEFVFKLIPVQLGTLKINEINIGYINLQTNENKIIIVPSIELSVKPYPKPKKKVFDGEIIDIKKQIWVKNYLWLILCLLLVLSILGWIVYQYKLKPRMQTQNLNIEQQVDIKEVALKKLDDLWQKNYLSLGLIKEFYFELTEIVRWYIEKKFEVNALELTTEELFNVLKKKVDKKYNLELKSFLDNADLAKFAKYRPDEKQIVQDFETAKKLII
jgi:hypothetical protein